MAAPSFELRPRANRFRTVEVREGTTSVVPLRRPNLIRALARECPRLLRFSRARISSHHRMAGMRRVFDHSAVLADDPSLRGALANTKGVAVSSAGTDLDGDVGDDGGN